MLRKAFRGLFRVVFREALGSTAQRSAAQPLARCHHHRYLPHCYCPSPNAGVLTCSLGSLRFCPSMVGAFGFGSDWPLLLRPASELNRILSSSWSSAPRVSIAASSGRATGQGRSSLRSRSVRPGVGCQGRLDPQRNRAQHISTHYDTLFQVSTARQSTAPGTVHRHRCLQHCKCPSPSSVSRKRFHAPHVHIPFRVRGSIMFPERASAQGSLLVLFPPGFDLKVAGGFFPR